MATSYFGQLMNGETLEVSSEPVYARGSGRTWMVSKCSLSAVWAYWLKRNDDDNEGALASHDNDSSETRDAGSTREHTDLNPLNYNLGTGCA